MADTVMPQSSAQAAAVVESIPPDSRINPSFVSAMTLPAQPFVKADKILQLFTYHTNLRRDLAQMLVEIHVAKCLGRYVESEIIAYSSR